MIDESVCSERYTLLCSHSEGPAADHRSPSRILVEFESEQAQLQMGSTEEYQVTYALFRMVPVSSEVSSVANAEAPFH